jgi:3-hydroxyisobutyrate dehydrogenase
MAKITILGTGLMGAGLAEAAARRGDSVTVWNRTASKAQALAPFGVQVAATPAAAVADADRVHVILNDDAAVDSVLAQALPGLTPRTPVIDHTTVSPAGTLLRRKWCDTQGIWFIHAPVFMSPQSCREGTGMMLCSGPADRYEAVRPALEKMTGQLWYLGERVDLAAAYKLFGNGMILAVVGGLADVYELGASLGVASPDVHSLFSKLKVAGTIDVRGAKMAQGDFAASFELAMARKDLRLMLEAASDPEALAVLPGVAKRVDYYLAQGNAQDDVGVIAREAVERSNKAH